MKLKRQIMRIAGAAIILIALALAPSAANAHAGHSHTTADSSASAPSAKGEVKASLAVKSTTALTEEASASVPQRTDCKSCDGGCCAAACVACCVATLGPAAGKPPYRATLGLHFPSTQSWDSIAADSLLRPPRTFA